MHAILNRWLQSDIGIDGNGDQKESKRREAERQKAIKEAKREQLEQELASYVFQLRFELQQLNGKAEVVQMLAEVESQLNSTPLQANTITQLMQNLFRYAESMPTGVSVELANQLMHYVTAIADKMQQLQVGGWEWDNNGVQLTLDGKHIVIKVPHNGLV